VSAVLYIRVLSESVNRDSSVNKATAFRLDDRDLVLPAAKSRPALSFTHPPVQRAPVALSPR
jgi:hypothetical protein